MRLGSIGGVLVALTVVVTFPSDRREAGAADRTVTWEASHPELREMFGHPFSPEGRRPW